MNIIVIGLAKVRECDSGRAHVGERKLDGNISSHPDNYLFAYFENLSQSIPHC